MKIRNFCDELGSLRGDVDRALMFDPDSWKSGRAARAFWNFVARFMTEAFSDIGAYEDTARLSNSDDQIIHALKEAQEDIERGVRKLALLLADPKIHDCLSAEFRQIGIIHPYDSHVGFRVRNHPKLGDKVGRFMAKQLRRGKSLDQMKRDLRLYLNQLDLKE